MVYPITSHNYDGLLHNTNFTIILSVEDFSESGIADTFYRINQGPIFRVSVNGQPLIINEGLNNVLEFWSRDNDNNQEPVKTITQIKLDKTGPTAIIDQSGLNGSTTSSSHNRVIAIHAEDAVLLCNTVQLMFIRDGIDSEPQTLALTLDVSGPTGTYYGSIDENPDQTEFTVTAIRYWIEGTDAAGNPITIGGTELSPLSQYIIDDLSPIFLDDFEPVPLIGQTKNVKNLGPTCTYFPENTIELEIRLNKSIFAVTANFSPIDSTYVPGQEIVLNLGSGIYRISYIIGSTNSLHTTQPITISATDGIGHSTNNVSFVATADSGFHIISTTPNNNSTNIHIDTQFVIDFSSPLHNDGLMSGHVYMTDACRRGIPIDVQITDSTLIVKPRHRLIPNEIYTVHATRSVPSETAILGYESLYTFQTGAFFLPFVPAGYVATNATSGPLTPSDNSLKIRNGYISITWPCLDGAVINGGDFRTGPIMLSDNATAMVWAKDAVIALKTPGTPLVVEIDQLTNVEQPHIKLENKTHVFGGILFENTIIPNYTFQSNTASILLNSVEDLILSDSEKPQLVLSSGDQFTRIFWTIDSLPDYGRAVITRENHPPLNISDGDTVYDGPRQTWYDVGLLNNQTYYYKLSLFDNLNRPYLFNIVQSNIPLHGYNVSYLHSFFETDLIYERANNPSNLEVIIEPNAIEDIATNNNQNETRPVFHEFCLNGNYRIVSTCEDSVTIELNTRLASFLRDSKCLLLLCKADAVKDEANNNSKITLLSDIVQETDWTEFPLTNASPIDIR